MWRRAFRSVFTTLGACMPGAEGGIQKRALAEKYRSYSRKLSFESPYVADLLEGIAEGYDPEAELWDSEDAVQRRLVH